MGSNDARTCDWCGGDVDRFAGDRSHGLCADCSQRVLATPHLLESELDALPFGLIEVDPVGTVLRYNAAEQALSGKPSASVVGRNFFVDIAPCAAVSSFQGRLSAFLASNADPEGFAFTFPFPSGAVNVRIAFVGSGRGTAFVLVKRRPE